MSHRVLFGGIWHETNSFSPVPTDLDAFQRFQFVEGPDLLDAYTDTNTELGGFVPAARELGLSLIPTIYAGAVPSGMVTRAALERVVQAITSRAAADELDGVFLVLHGAMMATGIDEADAYVAQRVREVVGTLPIVATFDLHANLSRALVDAADVLIGYDTLPHVDMAARGREAAQILVRLLDGMPRPRKAFRKLNLITVPQMQSTHLSPMRDIMEELAEIECRSDIVTASVAPGFAFTDVPHLGMAVVAYGDGADEATDQLAASIWSRRRSFLPTLLAPEEAIRRAVAAPRGPVILTEPADNVGGGAPGDATHVLRALFAAGAPSATVVLWDPAAAEAAARVGVGGRFRGSVGGHTLPVQGEPATIDGIVRFAGRVAYRRDASYMTGQPVDLGLVSMIEANGIRVVVTTERAMPFDTNHLRLVGIAPEQERIITTKCATAWSHAFGAICAAQFYVDTPGICPSNVERLCYTRLTGQFFPLQDL